WWWTRTFSASETTATARCLCNNGSSVAYAAKRENAFLCPCTTAAVTSWWHLYSGVFSLEPRSSRNSGKDMPLCPATVTSTRVSTIRAISLIRRRARKRS
ncbi:hypothetical protein M514_00851, partial [Trichuris suis]